MNRPFVAFLLLITLFGCAEETNKIQVDRPDSPQREDNAQEKPKTPSKHALGVVEARKWLESTVTEYFSEEIGTIEPYLTPQMNSYWRDQIETIYGDLSIDQFTEKWKSIYDVKRSTRDNGLLIDGQDNGPMRILSCLPVGRPVPNKYTFILKLRDELFKTEPTREITVIPSGSSFLIDEVKIIN